MPFGRRAGIDPVGIVIDGWSSVIFRDLRSLCAFRSLTPGPSPFSSTKITPAILRAALFATLLQLRIVRAGVDKTA